MQTPKVGERLKSFLGRVFSPVGRWKRDPTGQAPSNLFGYGDAAVGGTLQDGCKLGFCAVEAIVWTLVMTALNGSKASQHLVSSHGPFPANKAAISKGNIYILCTA